MAPTAGRNAACAVNDRSPGELQKHRLSPPRAAMSYGRQVQPAQRHGATILAAAAYALVFIIISRHENHAHAAAQVVLPLPHDSKNATKMSVQRCKRDKNQPPPCRRSLLLKHRKTPAWRMDIVNTTTQRQNRISLPIYLLQHLPGGRAKKPPPFFFFFTAIIIIRCTYAVNHAPRPPRSRSGVRGCKNRAGGKDYVVRSCAPDHHWRWGEVNTTSRGQDTHGHPSPPATIHFRLLATSAGRSSSTATAAAARRRHDVRSIRRYLKNTKMMYSSSSGVTPTRSTSSSRSAATRSSEFCRAEEQR